MCDMIVIFIVFLKPNPYITPGTVLQLKHPKTTLQYES